MRHSIVLWDSHLRDVWRWIVRKYLVALYMYSIHDIHHDTLAVRAHNWCACTIIICTCHSPLLLQIILPEVITPRCCHSAVAFVGKPSLTVVVLFGGSTSVFKGFKVADTTLLLWGKSTIIATDLFTTASWCNIRHSPTPLSFLCLLLLRSLLVWSISPEKASHYAIVCQYACSMSCCLWNSKAIWYTISTHQKLFLLIHVNAAF